MRKTLSIFILVIFTAFLTVCSYSQDGCGYGGSSESMSDISGEETGAGDELTSDISGEESEAQGELGDVESSMDMEPLDEIASDDAAKEGGVE